MIVKSLIMNSALLVWVLCAVSGASIARLIHADTLFAPLRNRWEVHWISRIERELTEADAILQVARGSRSLEAIGKLREEINKRADVEPGVALWTRRGRRRVQRPWSTVRDRLERYADYSEYISCRWCLPPYVFLVAVLWTWGRVYGFSWDVFTPVPIPLDYALIALVLGFRWIYAMIDTRFGHGH